MSGKYICFMHAKTAMWGGSSGLASLMSQTTERQKGCRILCPFLPIVNEKFKPMMATHYSVEQRSYRVAYL